MKLTKTMFLAALAAGGLLAWSTARAQDSTNMPAPTPDTNAPPPHMTNRGPNIDRFAKVLGLTDDQKEQVKPILDGQMQKRRDIMEDDTLSPEEKHNKIKALHDDTAAQLKPILTPEQFDKWQKLSQPRTRHMPPPPAAATNAPPASAP